MNKHILLLCILASSLSYLTAQTTIQLTFTAEANGIHHPLDSIRIANLTQGGDTTLYGTDTVLLLDHGIGIDDRVVVQGNQMILFPAYPNPVTHTSTIKLWLPQDRPVTLMLYDLLGRELTNFSRTLGAGEHSFTFTTGKETFYLLVAEAPDQVMVQKIISMSPVEGDCGISYTEHRPLPSGMRKGKSSFPWVPGDHLRFIGFTPMGTDTIWDNPAQSGLYTFQLTQALPPPIAGFSASDTIIQIPDTVYFTDLSTGNHTSWKWYFGDGASSLAQNPSHIYATIGFFDVTLIVCHQYGCDTLKKIKHITAYNSSPGQPCPGLPLVADYNGNLYNTVQIGNQCWMKEYLNARNYRTGAIIPIVTSNAQWGGLSGGAMSWYNNDSATYGNIYGALYNWYAVDNPDGLCPTGWHVPTDLEWMTLETYLGMSSAQALATGWRGTNEGGKLKATGTTFWLSPNTGATNSSAFTALPGGARLGTDGTYDELGEYADVWSSTNYNTLSAMSRNLVYSGSAVQRFNTYKKSGFSVRCIRD